MCSFISKYHFVPITSTNPVSPVDGRPLCTAGGSPYFASHSSSGNALHRSRRGLDDAGICV